MIFHENRLPADDSHKIPCLICYFEEVAKFGFFHLLQIIGGTLWVKGLRAEQTHYCFQSMKYSIRYKWLNIYFIIFL